MLNKEFEVTGHVPTLMATWLTRFLKRQTNQGRLVIKEKRVNRRGDSGLKVSCEYIFEGDDLFCEWLHRKNRRENLMSSAVLVYMCLALILLVFL